MDRSLLLFACALLAACSTTPGATPAGDASTDADATPPIDTPRDGDATPPTDNPVDTQPPADVPVGSTWCTTGRTVTQGRLPPGFCVKLFVGSPDTSVAHSPVMEPRVMVFAPNGDLFVSAPSTPTPGGASGGPGSILVLSDDNLDGTAEVHTFLSGLPDVHGIAFGPDALYYTVTGRVFRIGYTAGQRAAMGTAQMVGTLPRPGRWTHGLARSAGGTLYASNGVIAAACPSTDVGYVASVTPTATTTLAVGLRNPMSLRCHPSAELCMMAEMGDDGGASYGAREKLITIRAGTNYGFPCCAGPNLPVMGGPSCASVTQEEIVIPLGNSPFGFDWERGVWPGAMNGVLCIAQHGSFYSSPPWVGEGVYCTPTNPTTHVPADSFTMFLGGFSPSNQPAGTMLRPADVAFAPDGRMFVADDIANAVYWVAPETLARPAR